MGKAKRWHPSEESDEIVFAVCSRFLEHLGRQRDSRAAEDDGRRKGAAAAIAKWLGEEWSRGDLTRERIYPLLWEAARRNFLLLLPPREANLARRIAERYGVEHFAGHEDAIQVVNVRGPGAFGEVASVGADTVLELIQRLGKKKDRVHVGLGAGYAAMMVANSPGPSRLLRFELSPAGPARPLVGRLLHRQAPESRRSPISATSTARWPTWSAWPCSPRPWSPARSTSGSSAGRAPADPSSGPARSTL